MRTVFISAAIGAFVSSGVVTLIGEQLATRRTERAILEVRAEFARAEHTTEWKRQSLSTVVGPVVVQLERTRRAMQRYEANSHFIETEVLYKANLMIRDLLLQNGHLTPDELHDVANRLIEHYDRWLEEYDRVRGPEGQNLNEPFVFVGPKGSPFPRDADSLFSASFVRLRDELYGKRASQGAANRTDR
jgi:hypothetical protein